MWGTSSLGPASRAQAISAVRSFLGWCRAVGGARHLPDAETMRHVFAVPSAKVERPYQVLTDAEISALGRVAVEPRDRAILALLLGAGGSRAASACGERRRGRRTNAVTNGARSCEPVLTFYGPRPSLFEKRPAGGDRRGDVGTLGQPGHWARMKADAQQLYRLGDFLHFNSIRYEAHHHTSDLGRRMRTITECRIFIASPGGLNDIREAFRAELEHYNRMDARRRGLTFTAVGWEETLPAMRRP